MLQRLAIDVVYEPLSSQLNLIQLGEVALGTAHPGVRAVFYDRAYVWLIKSAA